MKNMLNNHFHTSDKYKKKLILLVIYYLMNKLLSITYKYENIEDHIYFKEFQKKS